MNGWHNVTKAKPCPVCGKPDWCTVSDDGMMCVCKRTDNGHPSKSGQGWIHVLVERPKREFVRRAPVRPVRPRLFDAAATMAGFREEMQAYHDGGDIFDSMAQLTQDVNLPAAQMDRLLVGRSAYYMSWAFPMLDGHGNTVGIRLRRYGSSDKFSVSGSRDGLFYDPDLQPIESLANGLKGREIVIVEGATDTVAAYCIGLPAVGRSSCSTGAEALRDLCSRLHVNRCTIVTDNDTYKTRADGSKWRPGIDGAVRLGRELGRAYRLVTPPKKDLREWYYAGLTNKTFWQVADLQPWRIK